MSHYKSNLRDIEFNLFEASQLEAVLGSEPFENFDRDTVMDILTEVDRLAKNEWSESYVEADRVPLELKDGTVVLHDSMKRGLDAFYDAGWEKVSVPKEFGGFGAPSQVRWGMQELLVGANPALFFYVSGGLMAVVLDMVGTPEQIKKWGIPMMERRWGGTMVLTEPAAGSDVGAGTTKAVHIEGDTYHLEGVKRFITSGEFDHAENIVHLVLARREGGEPGTPGLSMFIVPKFHVNDDGSIGERNGIVATNIEKKMGIKGSTTAELTMGTDMPCVGYLVGGVHSGIKQMFKVIEDARMLIGAKSAAGLSTGYLNALDYAKVRVQSADLSEMLDKTAPRVEIINHPDVRRMLMTQKAHAEGMRAMVHFVASLIDKAQMHPEEPFWSKAEDLMLPLLKGYSSEKAYELLAQSLQVFGGSGFTQDYPIEQYIRDAKIDSVYEGTTGIQALDLFFRKIARDQGATLSQLSEQILEMVKGGPDELATERRLLGAAMEDTQAHIGVMVGHLMASMGGDKPAIYKTGLHANGLLESLAEVVMAWLLLRHAEVALGAQGAAEGDDVAFYEGKIASARFFAHHALPKAKLRREAAEQEDGWLMEMSDEAF